jgi:SulP family sulfate permease
MTPDVTLIASSASAASTRQDRLARVAPGLAMLGGYRREWLRDDVAAGLSVAAVALPTAIAYAQLAGFPPVVGLYASILPLLIRSARPAEAVLGRVEGLQGFHDVAQHEGAAVVPGLVLYRFSASVIFYNAPYFKRRVLAIAGASPDATWLIVEGAPIVHLDSTGADTIVTLKDDLAARGIRLAFGGVSPQVRRMLERSGALEQLGADAVFPTLRLAVLAYESSAAAGR